MRLEGTAFVLDITAHKQGEHRISRYYNILEGINRIFGSVVRAETEEELGNVCLSVVLEVTGSQIGFVAVLHQLDQKIIYPHYDFKHLTEKYFEIGMKLNDFSIQLVKYCRW